MRHDVLTISTNEKTRVISYSQACELMNLSNLDWRIKRDLDLAMLIGWNHLNGWPELPEYSGGQRPRIDQDKIAFILYNDEDRARKGKPVVECVVLN